MPSLGQVLNPTEICYLVRHVQHLLWSVGDGTQSPMPAVVCLLATSRATKFGRISSAFKMFLRLISKGRQQTNNNKTIHIDRSFCLQFTIDAISFDS